MQDKFANETSENATKTKTGEAGSRPCKQDSRLQEEGQ